MKLLALVFALVLGQSAMAANYFGVCDVSADFIDQTAQKPLSLPWETVYLSYQAWTSKVLTVTGRYSYSVGTQKLELNLAGNITPSKFNRSQLNSTVVFGDKELSADQSIQFLDKTGNTIEPLNLAWTPEIAQDAGLTAVPGKDLDKNLAPDHSYLWSGFHVVCHINSKN